MSKLDDLTIDMIEANLPYIKLGLNNDKCNQSNAEWLYYLIKSYSENVCMLQRAQAIAERTRLNGTGYSGKASH